MRILISERKICIYNLIYFFICTFSYIRDTPHKKVKISNICNIEVEYCDSIALTENDFNKITALNCQYCRNIGFILKILSLALKSIS